MQNIKNEKGVTIIVVILAVILMIIIIGTITLSLRGVQDVQNLNKLYNDIKVLDSRIGVYYLNNKTLPIAEKCENITNIQEILNPNDNQNYYYIDVTKLDNIKLNFNGYIINEQSHTIYYPEGIMNEGKMYYALEIDYTPIEVKTLVNEPNLSKFNKQVTYYVTWNEDENNQGTFIENSNIKINEQQPEEWFDYSLDKKKWANIKTIGNNNVIYWVWIPRFAYMINQAGYNTNQEQIIDVKFLKDETNIPYGEAEEITNKTIGSNKWVVHPAFTVNERELDGIWVAKFEASSSNAEADYGGGNTDTLQVNSIPNIRPWRNIDINKIFTVCRKIEAIDGSLGLNMAIENIDTETGIDATANIDTHLIKNIEWGAIAYLSKSKYGNNEEIWINSYYEAGKTGMTGESSNITSTSDLTKYNEYNIGNGPKASTTGNVYGIYDTNGGLNEYVAAFVSNTKANTNIACSKLVSANIKYINKYNIGLTDTQSNNFNKLLLDNRYGDALYETAINVAGQYTWEDGRAYFPNTDNPIFTRGGDYSQGSEAGIFAFEYADGNANVRIGFRPSLYIW